MQIGFDYLEVPIWELDFESWVVLETTVTPPKHHQHLRKLKNVKITHLKPRQTLNKKKFPLKIPSRELFKFFSILILV